MAATRRRTTTDRRATRRPATALLVAGLVVLALAGTAGTAAQTYPREDLPPVAEAPAGTVFQTHFSTAGGGGRAVGLVKRGRSGQFLFNPSVDSVTLARGDTLVARSGRWYRVAVPQSLAGSAGFVGPNATVYQGERGVRYVGFGGRPVGTGTAANATMGLRGRVPVDQPTGVYVDPLTREPALAVREPRVSDLRVLDRFGDPVEPGDQLASDEFVLVVARANFLDAERLRLRLVDRSTGRTVTRGALTRRRSRVQFPVRFDTVERVVPPGAAVPEGPDGTVRSLANPATRPGGSVYLIQSLRPVRQPGRYDFVVGADARAPFGDFAGLGVERRAAFRHTLARSTFLATPTWNGTADGRDDSLAWDA